MSATQPWDSRGPSFTLADLERAMEGIEMPRWRRMIRDATDVAVKPSSWLSNPDDAFVLDPNAESWWPDTLPVLVVCAPARVDEVRELVRLIRADHPENGRTA